jgi:hypothetical protein
MTKYDLRVKSGVLILDPGANHTRLGLGRLVPGNVFWVAGDKSITNVREFIAEILRINELKENGINQGRKGSVRVVYSYSRHIYDGTNTQHLKLTDADVEELRQFLAKSE